MQRPPTVEEVRPGQCPACEAPSRPAGGTLGLHGHGLRERHQWGPAEVRARVSPLRIVGATAAAGWASLRRWSRAVRAGRLFPVVRTLPAEATLRQVAARTATTLAAYAPGAEGLAIDSAAFLGAAHVS